MNCLKNWGSLAFHNNNAVKLSGGETAKMVLARLMMKSYDLLILDEPTASMDMESTLSSEELIKQYCKETNCMLVLVTHSLQQARRTADDVLYLQSGNLVEFGCADKVLSFPHDDRTRRFLDFYGV